MYIIPYGYKYTYFILKSTRTGLFYKNISPSTHKEHTANGAIQDYRSKVPHSQTNRNGKKRARHWHSAIAFPGMH